MRIIIKPLQHGQQHRQVLIGRAAKGRLTRTARAHVLSGLNRWRAYNGMRFPTVAAARTWLKKQFANVDDAPPPAA